MISEQERLEQMRAEKKRMIDEENAELEARTGFVRRKLIPPGSVVTHHDRNYVVQKNGEWRRASK